MTALNLTILAAHLEKTCGVKATALWIRNLADGAKTKEGHNPGKYWALYGFKLKGESDYFLDSNGQIHQDLTEEGVKLLGVSKQY
jgi:hypothetical protein